MLYDSVNTHVLPRAVRPAQVILNLTRAYRSLGHPVIPPIIETVGIYIPFYVFTCGNTMRTLPAIGLPHRLITHYQFKPLIRDESARPLSDMVLFNPDLCLSAALENAGTAFTEQPVGTRVRIVAAPFYRISVQYGSSETEILMNAYNADVLLEKPPPEQTIGRSRSSLVTAVFTFSALVMLITGTWILSRSMTAAAGMAAVSVWVIRSRMMRS